MEKKILSVCLSDVVASKKVSQRNGIEVYGHRANGIEFGLKGI
jgi:hypothetical protein